MISDVERLSSTCWSFEGLLKKMSTSSAHFLTRLFGSFFAIELYEFFIYFGYMICEYFLLFHRLPFHFVDSFLGYAKAFSLMWSYLVSFMCHTNFRFFFYFCEKCHLNFDRDCLESIYCFKWYGHFNNINSSNPWRHKFFPFICVLVIFFHQCLILFSVEIFLLLGYIYS